MKCDLATLQDASLTGAMEEGGTCECRHDNYMDGEGDSKETEKIKGDEDALRLVGKGMTTSIGLIVGVAAGIGLCTAIACILLRKKRGDEDYGELEEEEWEEEEEEE